MTSQIVLLIYEHSSSGVQPIEVPKEYLRKQTNYVTQMAKSYFQQDDMMEIKKKINTYCDKNYINKQKELVKEMWNL